MKAQSNVANLLAKIAGDPGAENVTPKNMKEYYLNEIAENSGGGGGADSLFGIVQTRVPMASGVPIEPSKVYIKDPSSLNEVYGYHANNKTLVFFYDGVLPTVPIVNIMAWIHDLSPDSAVAPDKYVVPSAVETVHLSTFTDDDFSDFGGLSNGEAYAEDVDAIKVYVNAALDNAVDHIETVGDYTYANTFFLLPKNTRLKTS